MKVLTIIYFIALTGQNANAQTTGFFRNADSFFKTYVEDGKVDYKRIYSERSLINKLYSSLAEIRTDNLNTSEEKAFYINAYNIITIYSVLDHYPVKSVMDIQGFFNELEHPVAGKKLTLDQLEKSILMKKFFDPRLHFVLVCGAMSCPPLAGFAYLPDNLDNQIKQMTEKALNNPEFLKKTDSGFQLSKIFKWYNSDFLNSAGSLPEYINKYRKEKLPENYEIRYYEYDWSLNQS